MTRSGHTGGGALLPIAGAWIESQFEQTGSQPICTKVVYQESSRMSAAVILRGSNERITIHQPAAGLDILASLFDLVLPKAPRHIISRFNR
jgi:hypothetical protein